MSALVSEDDVSPVQQPKLVGTISIRILHFKLRPEASEATIGGCSKLAHTLSRQLIQEKFLKKSRQSDGAGLSVSLTYEQNTLSIHGSPPLGAPSSHCAFYTLAACRISMKLPNPIAVKPRWRAEAIQHGSLDSR